MICCRRTVFINTRLKSIEGAVSEWCTWLLIKSWVGTDVRAGDDMLAGGSDIIQSRDKKEQRVHRNISEEDEIFYKRDDICTTAAVTYVIS